MILLLAGFIVLSVVTVIAGIQRDCLPLTLITAMPFYLLGLGMLLYEASLIIFNPNKERHNQAG